MSIPRTKNYHLFLFFYCLLKKVLDSHMMGSFTIQTEGSPHHVDRRIFKTDRRQPAADQIL